MTASQHAVEIKALVKRYGEFVATRDIDLTVEDGAFVTLLGPSGCGKTTTLKVIAGLEQASEGEITIKGRRVNDVPIHKRNLGLVFQNYALFPHKSVQDNVAFGLKYRSVSKAEAAERVKKALDLVRLPHVGDRYPAQLSGGQQQRIALARAIVIQPDVLLLDEPLSALDANLREEMRVELKRIQRELGVATVFVTHDQSEALAMSDKVVVMNQGRIEQIGSPEDVYNAPCNEFVATFLGNSNILDAEVSEKNGQELSLVVDGGMKLTALDRNARFASGDRLRLVLRAERLKLTAQTGEFDKASSLDATVNAVDYQGLAARYFLQAGPHTLQAINPIEGRPFAEGAAVKLTVRPDDCVLLPATA